MKNLHIKVSAGRRSPNPFTLDDDGAYERWRAQKLEGYPDNIQDLVVEISDPLAPTRAEVAEIKRICRKTNMAIYAFPRKRSTDKETIKRFGRAFGLTSLDRNLLADDDGITSLQVAPGKSRRGYIPYSNRRLLWHTDGYYNSPERRIRSLLMHCVSPAARGGENALLDHEIAYILLRDADPEHVRMLMAPDAMTIPANLEDTSEPRPPSTGPVFLVDPASGNLLMRYTARTRSIQWKADLKTRQAVSQLERILAAESPYLFRYRFSRGQGLLCNNVLHNRGAFEDDPKQGAPRLLFRARYHDRIAGTDVDLEAIKQE